MEKGDFSLTSQVRNVLIHNWVVPRRLSVSMFEGIVRISGPLSKIPATYLQNDCSEVLDVLEREIREIPGVKELEFDLPEISDSAPARKLDAVALAGMALQERMIRLEEARVKEHPNYPDLRNRLGLFLAFAGGHEDALLSFEKALEANPNYYEAIINRAFSLGSLDRYGEAAASFDKLTETGRPDVYFWLAAARLCAANKDIERAQVCLNEARNTEHDLYLIHHALGLTAILAGDAENAERHIKNALGSETLSKYYSDSGIWNGLDLEQDRIESMTADFATNPNFVNVYVERALHCGHDGDYDSARMELANAFEIAPASPQAAMAYARISAAQGETELAISRLRQALVHDPGFTAAYIEIAFQYGALGNLVEARAALETARGLQPRYPDVRYHLGILSSEMKDNEGTIRELGEAIRINPRYIFASLALGNIYFKAGMHQDVISVYEGITPPPSLRARIQKQLGLTYLETGDNAKASDHFERAIEEEPESAELHYHLAEARIRLGDSQKAFQEIGHVFRYVKRGPIFEAAAKFVKQHEEK
ncbi:MAG: tetratricopeptide repeat protein [Planctomycetota bacterium]|jgi:tetratricopeptide (TPR) repeat protein